MNEKLSPIRHDRADNNKHPGVVCPDRIGGQIPPKRDQSRLWISPYCFILKVSLIGTVFSARKILLTGGPFGVA
jgi:hypothetical protein